MLGDAEAIIPARDFFWFQDPRHSLVENKISYQAWYCYGALYCVASACQAAHQEWYQSRQVLNDPESV